jgi:hypothetical protein
MLDNYFCKQGPRNSECLINDKLRNLERLLREGFSFDELRPGGCVRSSQQQLGTWEPSQHLLEGRGKPRKPVSGRRTFRTTKFTYEINSYLTENTLCLYCENQTFTVVQENNRCLF